MGREAEEKTPDGSCEELREDFSSFFSIHVFLSERSFFLPSFLSVFLSLSFVVSPSRCRSFFSLFLSFTFLLTFCIFTFLLSFAVSFRLSRISLVVFGRLVKEEVA